jgi:hypothetical protein
VKWGFCATWAPVSELPICPNHRGNLYIWSLSVTLESAALRTAIRPLFKMTLLSAFARGRVPEKRGQSRARQIARQRRELPWRQPTKRTILLLTAISAFAGCTDAPKALFQSAQKGVKPTVPLTIMVDGVAVKEGASVPVTPGQALQLKVSVQHLDRTISDVSRDAKTKWLSETPGVIGVSPEGKVVVLSHGGGGGFFGSEKGAVGVFYGVPGDKEIGATSIGFEIKSEKTTEGELSAVADRTSLGLGESARIKVTRKLQNGRSEDISADPKTVYITTSESVLIPEGSGIVTHIGTKESSVDEATVSVFYGQSFKQISFTLKNTGQGPGLKIETQKTTLEEGEAEHFAVVREKDGAVLTARATGTQYVVFGGKGTLENELLTIDDALDTITAPRSLGRYNRRSANLFVRNGDLVGWTELKLIHAPASRPE